MKILMVCLGNICRSPLAEGILQSKVNSDFIQVDSAGTAAYHIGNLPDPRSIDVARKYGIDLTHQRARQFSVYDFDTFDLIYAMDESNYQNILTLSRNIEDEAKVKMILNETNMNTNKSVPDPYYGENDGFEIVFGLLEEACSVIAKKVE